MLRFAYSPICAFLISCVYNIAEEGGATLSIKILVDVHGKKVLFAEPGKDFIDLLFHIMTLPLGTVIRLLKSNGMVGCVGNLYRSIENIDSVYMEAESNKEVLLKPKSPSCRTSIPLLLPGSSPSASKTYYKCSARASCYTVSDSPGKACPSCHVPMKQQVVFSEVEPLKAGTSYSDGYVKGVVTYMVMDNLEVKPMSTISSITILNQFKVKDVGSLEEKVIAIGMREALELLKASLFSENVLTAVFFSKVDLVEQSQS